MNSESTTSFEGVKFYTDRTGKTRSADPEKLPYVLVFAWDTESRGIADKLCALETSFPAIVHTVEEVKVHESLLDVVGGDVLACVLFVTRAAIGRPSFDEVVKACTGEITLRPDFRLFVHLVGGLTFDDLMKIKNEWPNPDNPVEALIDSVHIPSYLDKNPYETSVRLLQNYLSELPQFRNRVTFEAWKNQLNAPIKWFFYVLILQMIVSTGILALFGTKLINSDLFPWLLFGLGQLLFLSTLALFSLSTRLVSNFLSRCILAVMPVIWFNIIPLAVITPHWMYLLAGFFTGAITDVAWRMLIRLERKQCVVQLRHESNMPLNVPVPGKRYFHFLLNGPIFPQHVHVFISYSESSPWSAAVAVNLHNELAKLHITSFFAPDSIEPGSSWRYRLQDEIGRCTVFIFLLDEVSATKRWPEAELRAASLLQFKSGLPAIIVLHHLGMNHNTIQHIASNHVLALLQHSSDAEPSLLRIIEHASGKESLFAQSISKKYQWQAVSVIPVYLASFLELPFLLIGSLLSYLGVLGSFVVWATMATIVWFKLHGIDPVSWLGQHQLISWFFLLSAYLLGFSARLALGVWFEMRYRLPGMERIASIATGWKKLEVIVLLFLCISLLTSTSYMGLVYAAITCALGIVLGSFYIEYLLIGLDLKDIEKT